VIYSASQDSRGFPNIKEKLFDNARDLEHFVLYSDFGLTALCCNSVYTDILKYSTLKSSTP